MKQLLSILLVLAFCLLQPMTAHAVGDGNIDGGGGDMDDANSHGSWSSGNDGVRVTVVRSSDHAVVTTPIDLTNKAQSASSLYHFGKVSKLQYNGGVNLSSYKGGYASIKPTQAIPRIVSSNGSSNIEAIKSYFTDEQVIRAIADQVGMDFDTLIGGEYKLLLEPLAYFRFEGVMIAATATEAALYDETVGGQLRRWMGYLTAKNLPLAMFLETPDLGYPAWSGSRTNMASNADIKSSLGLGIVRFEELPEPPPVSEYDYVYRVNTDVITSVMVRGGQSDPDDPTRVSFNIAGQSYSVGNVYYPEGDSQLAWVRWTTPATPQDMTITVRVSGPGSAQSTIRCKIVDLDKNPPPNPMADDRNDSFSRCDVPARDQKTSTYWTVWKPWWYEYWVWHSDDDDDDDDDGYWCDHGWWEFDLNRYSASLSSAMQITTDSKNPTASGRTMKSGYGINQVVTANVSSTQSSATTSAQNAVSYFPEFGYERYWRLLDRVGSGYKARFEFKQNGYSTYRGRTHFTPIWMPDGSYKVNTWLIDCWTPTGMLSMSLADSLTIRGSLWDDWHIAPLKP